jgi:hypothetical protein
MSAILDLGTNCHNWESGFFLSCTILCKKEKRIIAFFSSNFYYVYFKSFFSTAMLGIIEVSFTIHECRTRY